MPSSASFTIAAFTGSLFGVLNLDVGADCVSRDNYVDSESKAQSYPAGQSNGIKRKRL